MMWELPVPSKERPGLSGVKSVAGNPARSTGSRPPVDVLPVRGDAVLVSLAPAPPSQPVNLDHRAPEQLVLPRGERAEGDVDASSRTGPMR